jgi:hypothetical protein
MDKAPSPPPLPPAYLFMSAVGVLGFVGLLVASHYVPEAAAPLRVSAFAWFLCFGVLRAILFWRR